MSANNGKEVLIRVDKMTKYFPIKRGLLQRHIGDVKAVDGVSFDIFKGETLGLVGESGCGKTTTGRTILQLYPLTSGKVYLGDTDLTTLKGKSLRTMRRQMQMIFQDPYASLNPRMTVGNLVGAPLTIHSLGSQSSVEKIVAEPMKIQNLTRGKNTQKYVSELLELVGLNPDFINRYPHEFSGGQRQRVGIARALALKPDFIVCDEPIAALDVSIQAQVVNLLKDLQKKFGLTYLFIAHDLSMVRHISDRIAVMYLGKIVELTDKKTLYANPQHPYTKALLSAVPIPDPVIEEQRERIVLEGDLPSPSDPPEGCNFNTRCPFAKDICFASEPAFKEQTPGHWVACHLVE